MEEVTYVYFDLETTARGPDNSPDAHHKNNEVVVVGYTHDNLPVIDSTINEFCSSLEILRKRGKPVVLVAHNLKFDLKYLLRDRSDIPWHLYRYVCTMTMEYRLSGHDVKFVSLEELAARYHIPFTKGLDLGALIAQGLDIKDDIDREDLIDYLKADVEVLRDIHDKQIDDGMCVETINLDYILPLAAMELNGLPVDSTKIAAAIKAENTIHKVQSGVLETIMLDNLVWSNGDPLTASDIKILAPRSLSYLLTGYPKHGLGAVKDKKHIVFHKNRGPLLEYLQIRKVWGTTTPSSTLGYPINASVLDTLCSVSIPAAAYKAAKDANKVLNTYLFPFASESLQTGGTIHPKLNTCATNTGRLSSSSPNGQNIPPKVRELIVNTEGMLYDIDFSQLEMIGAATLSGDKQMISDINHDVDIHYETGKTVMGWTSPSDMSKDSRRVVKAVNFGLLYGGGAAGISESSGVDKKIVKALIDSFYARYPGVATWQEEVYNDVVGASFVAGHKNGESYKRALYRVHEKHGGRVFSFTESESPPYMVKKTGRKFSFKPTETKNYPIQGFAGGDIVMGCLSVLYDVLAGTSAKMRMTVHDSILIDWKEGKETDLEFIMTKVCDVVSKDLGIPVPLKFEIQSNKYWV